MKNTKSRNFGIRISEEEYKELEELQKHYLHEFHEYNLPITKSQAIRMLIREKIQEIKAGTKL